MNDTAMIENDNDTNQILMNGDLVIVWPHSLSIGRSLARLLPVMAVLQGAQWARLDLFKMAKHMVPEFRKRGLLTSHM